MNQDQKEKDRIAAEADAKLREEKIKAALAHEDAADSHNKTAEAQEEKMTP